MLTVKSSEGAPVTKIDGPSTTLLNVMKDRELLTDWKNYRVLTSK